MAKLKVFGGLMSGRGKTQVRTIIATTSKKRAAELLGVTIGTINNFWCVTGNQIETTIALANPEVVFQTSSLDSKDFIQVTANPITHDE